MTKRETLEAAAMGAGCLGRSADDEPVFVLCARDPLAANLVRAWAFKYEMVRGAEARATVEEALLVAELMDLWRRQKGGV